MISQSRRCRAQQDLGRTKHGGCIARKSNQIHSSGPIPGLKCRTASSDNGGALPKSELHDVDTGLRRELPETASNVVDCVRLRVDGVEELLSARVPKRDYRSIISALVPMNESKVQCTAHQNIAPDG